MVLAEDAAQAASGEKDGTGTRSTGDAWLLPIMQRGSGSHELSGLPTVSSLTGETVHMAGTGAKHTVGHDVTEPGVGIIIRKSSSLYSHICTSFLFIATNIKTAYAGPDSSSTQFPHGTWKVLLSAALFPT